MRAKYEVNKYKEDNTILKEDNRKLIEDKNYLNIEISNIKGRVNLFFNYNLYS